MMPLGELAGLKLVAQLALVIWMVTVAAIDHRQGRVPNGLTAPVMFGMGAFRLYEALRGEHVRLLLIVVWALLFGLWLLHFLGGGDAKFLMALFALFPSMEFVAVLALILLVVMVPIVLWGARGSSPRAALRALRDRVVTMQVLPTEAELRTRGRRYAWTFALPGIVYTLFYW